MKFQFEVPKEVVDACNFLAMQAEKKHRQDIFAASKKISASPVQEVTKNLPETNSIPTQPTQPVYKLPVYKSYTPEEVIQLEAAMQVLFDA